MATDKHGKSEECREHRFVLLVSDLYIDDIMCNLAGCFDVAINDGGYAGNLVAAAFISTGLAKRFERCDPAIVAGKSGAETAQTIIQALDPGRGWVEPRTRFERTPEYWAGWCLGNYQCKTGRSYSGIFRCVDFEQIVSWYHPLHEADVSKFRDQMEQRFKAIEPVSNLRRYREAAGLSQSQLASVSGVGLRAIQMYEQHQKDIDHAQGITLFRLSRSLSCEMEDLLER